MPEEKLTFKNDYASLTRLEKIMFSYPSPYSTYGYYQMGDMTASKCLLSLVVNGAINVSEHTYAYDHDIRENPELVRLYRELARLTRWKQNARTFIETVRMNALWQMREMGRPAYDDYVQYQNGQCEMHCGDISPHEMLTRTDENENLQEFYIFCYPFSREDNTAVFYRFSITAEASAVAKSYRNVIRERMRQVMMDVDRVIPPPPTDEK